MAAIFQTTFSSAFSWMKMHKFRLSFHWNLLIGSLLELLTHWGRDEIDAIRISLQFVPNGPINNIPALVQIMAWRRHFLTYPAIFLHTQQCHTTIWQCQIFFRPALSDRQKNSITMILIRHFDRCLYFHDQSQRFLRELWLCKVTARWPDLTHLSVHSLVNGVRSTRTRNWCALLGQQQQQ